MKKFLLLLVFIPSIIVADDEIYSRFYPEGTTWTEIVLDTLAHDSWFSKEGDNWVANFETVTYYVKGQLDLRGRKLNCVYTQIAGEPDSWAFVIEDPASQYMDFKWVDAGIIMVENGYTYSFLGLLYHFDWVEGESFRKSNPLINTLSFGPPHETIYYGIIEKIEEGDFGGVRPLSYVDLTAEISYPNTTKPTRYYPVRMIQGIGVTTWDGPQCILGPVEIMTTLPKEYLVGNPFMAWFKSKYGTEDSHHRSMLVHFERNGEVLYDVWPSPEDYAYRPLVEEGKVWNMELVYTWVGWPDYGVVRTEKWELKGDTVIDGVTYKKYYVEGVYRGAMREENQKIFIQYKFNNQEVLLYDFGLKEGERFTSSDGQEYLFTSEDYVEYDNKELRRMKLVNVNDSRDINYWIEGIGALAGPTTPFYYGMTGGEDTSIASCYVGDQCIYRRNENSIQLPATDADKSSALFDLSGRKLNTTPQKGIYIREGKKYIHN